MINRGVLILKYREPVVRWINQADPYDDTPKISLASANDDRNVYLIDDNVAGNPEALDRWLQQNFQMLFETELEGWYRETDLWPRELSFELFSEWFEVEVHALVRDTVGDEIYDDES